MSGTTATKRLVRTALALGVAGLLALLSGGLVLALEGTAQADPVCVPSEAWTETVVVSEAVPATPESWTEWADEGDEVRTEEKQAPAEDTDTVRYVYVGATEVEVVTAAQHYSLGGGSWKSEEYPAYPDPGEPFKWVPNTEKEPHEQGGGNPATWVDQVGEGLHYTGAPGNSNWFYFQPEVTDVDHLWQKQTRELVPGTPEVPAVVETVEHPAVVCPPPTTPTETPTTPTETPTTPTETPTTPTETPTTAAPPEVLPSTATLTAEPTDQPTAQPVEEAQEAQPEDEAEEPEVLPAEASQSPQAQAPQAQAPQAQQVPTAVAAGYAGWTDAELLGAALVGGGLAMLVSSGTVLVVSRRE